MSRGSGTLTFTGGGDQLLNVKFAFKGRSAAQPPDRQVGPLAAAARAGHRRHVRECARDVCGQSREIQVMNGPFARRRGG